MNQYLSHITKKAGDTSNSSNELKDAGVIGGIGMGTHLIATHTTDALGINGPKAKKVANATPFAERAMNALKSPLKSVSGIAKSPALKKNLKVGAIGGAVGLLGDYAAVKLNKHMNKQAEQTDNKYLEKIAETKVQGIRNGTDGKPLTDKELAARGTGIRLSGMAMGKLVPGMGLVGLGTSIGHHIHNGRDVKGALREETRGALTSAAESVGYGLAGAAGAGALGAGIGKLVGNRGVAKVGANAVAKLLSLGGKANPTQVLDSLATSHPEHIRKILGHKHLGPIGGAVMGGTAGLLAGGVYGTAKGEYDGRLASIRNQINEGRIANLINTKGKK